MTWHITIGYNDVKTGIWSFVLLLFFGFYGLMLLCDIREIYLQAKGMSIYRFSSQCSENVSLIHLCIRIKVQIRNKYCNS